MSIIKYYGGIKYRKGNRVITYRYKDRDRHFFGEDGELKSMKVGTFQGWKELTKQEEAIIQKQKMENAVEEQFGISKFVMKEEPKPVEIRKVSRGNIRDMTPPMPSPLKTN